MRDSMHLRIAGWSVALRIDAPALAAPLAARFAAFAGPAVDRPDLAVQVGHDQGAGEPAGNSQSILQSELTVAGDNYLLDSPGYYGMICAPEGRAALRFRSTAFGCDPSHEVEYFLRVALALFALRHDGLLIHCAALKRSDSVFLFIGQSGSGKSTVVALSQLAHRATALGDDLIVVRREAGLWRAFGTPFWNFEAEMRDGQHEQGPVARIYKLVQDRGVFVERMGRAAAIAELVANCPVVNDQPALLPGLIERCRALAEAVAVERLHFRKDDSFWDVVAGDPPAQPAAAEAPC